MNAMDTKEAIFTRRSIRAYENKPVDPGLVRQMIEAAVQAPCGMGIEPWKFAVIQDREVLTDLSGRTKTHMLGMIDQIPPLAQYRETLENPGFDVLYGAPGLVLICCVPNSSPTKLRSVSASRKITRSWRRSPPVGRPSRSRP
jgi:nitroreductase